MATALAIIVLPVPGGPYIKTPLGGSIPNLVYNSGYFNGNSIDSLISYFYTSKPPISENVTSDLLFTFIIYILTSASVGKISTTADECLCKATDELGFNFSLSNILNTHTNKLLPWFAYTNPYTSSTISTNDPINKGVL